MDTPVSTESRPSRLRVVVFTSGPLSPVNRAFYERLATDPLLELQALIVDEYQRPKKPFVLRIVRGFREEGWPWLWYKCTLVMGALIRKTALSLFERMHGRAIHQESYETLTREGGIRVYPVPDIHHEQSLALIRSLRPQLGVIVGGRILRDTVITVPEYGTLNIHKRKVPDYRGGGPIGYWELLAGEASIGVTIHYAVSQVDAGDVLGEATIPIEECDTLESLKIKADIVGARLYHDTIRRVALGFRQGTPQDTSRGRTYRSPSEFKVWQFEGRLRQKAAKTMPALRASPSRGIRMRVLAQYILLLPWLVHLRERWIKQHRAPICILFAHVVANRPVNHMCWPLETFVTQIEFLRRYYAVVSLDEAVQRLRSGKNEELVAAITFDDGYTENEWAIEYLQYLGIPAAFFVSIGHVCVGRPFEHDLRRGFGEAHPMSDTEVRRLASQGFVVGSHGLYHEDFGSLDTVTAERVMVQSRRMIGEVTGQVPIHFSFPKGQVANMPEETVTLALQYYPYIYSAFGGYNFPDVHRRHFFRVGFPGDLLELVMVMGGYTGFRACLGGNAWGVKTDARLPVGVHADDASRSRVPSSSEEPGPSSSSLAAETTRPDGGPGGARDSGSAAPGRSIRRRTVS